MCGAFATERGYREAHLHFQGVIIMKVPTACAPRKYVTEALGRTCPPSTPPNAKLACKALTQKALYTFGGMLG